MQQTPPLLINGRPLFRGSTMLAAPRLTQHGDHCSRVSRQDLFLSCEQVPADPAVSLEACWFGELA